MLEICDERPYLAWDGDCVSFSSFFHLLICSLPCICMCSYAATCTVGERAIIADGPEQSSRLLIFFFWTLKNGCRARGVHPADISGYRREW